MFLFFSYYAAVEAKKERTSKHAQSFGTKSVSHNTTASQVSVIALFLSSFPIHLYICAVVFSCAVLVGSSSVADAAELSVSATADSSGGVHVLTDAL